MAINPRYVPDAPPGYVWVSNHSPELPEAGVIERAAKFINVSSEHVIALKFAPCSVIGWASFVEEQYNARTQAVRDGVKNMIDFLLNRDQWKHGY